MLRLGNDLTLQYQRRTLRPQFVQTQGTPYPMALSANFDRTAGALSGAQAVTGAKAAILPGQVAIKLVGESVTLYGSNEGAGTDTATTAVVRPWGLFANYVGGQMDELAGRSEVGVWRGQGSVYEILAPAFNDTGLSAAGAGETGASATAPQGGAYMSVGADARVAYNSSATNPFATTNLATARLVERYSASAIVVELLV